MTLVNQLFLAQNFHKLFTVHFWCYTNTANKLIDERFNTGVLKKLTLTLTAWLIASSYFVRAPIFEKSFQSILFPQILFNNQGVSRYLSIGGNYFHQSTLTWLRDIIAKRCFVDPRLWASGDSYMGDNGFTIEDDLKKLRNIPAFFSERDLVE